MISDIKKLPVMPIENEIDPSFQKVSWISDQTSSMYLSLGISLLEALTRLKSSQHPAPVWEKYMQALSTARDYSHYWNTSELMQTMNKIIATLKSPDYSSKDCLAWLNNYLESNACLLYTSDAADE